MSRLIASYAKKDYETTRETGNTCSPEAARLLSVSMAGQSAEDDVMSAYDAISDIFQRSMKNTSMIPMWDELTAPIIEQF